MRIGLAKSMITPNLPVALAGYAKERIAKEVHDEIQVKVLVYEENKQYYGLISYDVVAIDAYFMEALQEKLQKKGLLIEHFVVSATHTHSAPGGLVNCSKGMLKGTQSVFMEYDEPFFTSVLQMTMQAIQEAIQDCQEATLHIAKGRIAKMGGNRNDPSLVGNDALWVAYIEQVNGKQAMVYNFACHPTILTAENKQVSADFPGYIQQACEQDGYFYSLFLNGSCGDISTRYTRTKEQYEELNDFGSILYSKMKQMKQQAKAVKDFTTKRKTITIPLQLKEVDTLEKAQEEYDQRLQALQEAKANGYQGSALRSVSARVEGALLNLLRAKNRNELTSCNISIAIYHLGQEVFICIPGELFSQLSNAIQTETIHFITYANGYYGYFANEKAYEEKYYEALSSPFEKGQAEYMMNIIKEALDAS